MQCERRMYLYVDDEDVSDGCLRLLVIISYASCVVCSKRELRSFGRICSVFMFAPVSNARLKDEQGQGDLLAARSPSLCRFIDSQARLSDRAQARPRSSLKTPSRGTLLARHSTTKRHITPVRHALCLIYGLVFIPETVPSRRKLPFPLKVYRKQ